MTPGKFSPLTWIKSIIRSDLKPTVKLVAVTLVTYANADGTNAHPGRQRIADDLDISISTVKRALKTLATGRWIAKTSNGRTAPNRNWADVYQLLVHADLGSKVSDHGSNQHDHGSQACTPTCSSTPDPLHLSDCSASGSPSRAIADDNDDDFEPVEEWIEAQIGLDRTECSTALGMWESGSNPHAIKNKILADRSWA